jgi:hypothetical protein
VQSDDRDQRETLNDSRDLSRSIDRDGVCSAVLPLQISGALDQNRKWRTQSRRTVPIDRVVPVPMQGVSDDRAIGNRGSRACQLKKSPRAATFMWGPANLSWPTAKKTVGASAEHGLRQA